MTDFLNFLRDRIGQVREAETTALAMLNTAGDEAGYRKAMERKAQILAELASDAQPFLRTLTPGKRAEAVERLEAFSQSAHNSLEIGSVFYMSALLYPEDHQPGHPNNLELWLAELENN